MQGAPSDAVAMTCCPTCTRRGRTRTVHALATTYERLPASTPKPDLSVAYNCGAHEHPQSWRPAFEKLVDDGRPFVFTSLNQPEAEGDLAVVRKAAGATSLDLAWPIERCPFRQEHLSFECAPRLLGQWLSLIGTSAATSWSATTRGTQIMRTGSASRAAARPFKAVLRITPRPQRRRQPLVLAQHHHRPRQPSRALRQAAVRPAHEAALRVP
jgi:hypothetical protein